MINTIEEKKKQTQKRIRNPGETQEWGRFALLYKIVSVGLIEIVEGQPCVDCQGRTFQAEGKTEAKPITWESD